MLSQLRLKKMVAVKTFRIELNFVFWGWPQPKEKTPPLLVVRDPGPLT